jgi:hypothetical protein
MGLGAAWRGHFLCKEDFRWVRIPRAPLKERVMPSQKDKSVKAKRRHKTYVKAKKQMKNWNASITNFDKTIGTNVKKLSLGHFAKNHALGCGVPMCGLCGNKRRVHKEKTMQEKKHEQKGRYDE